MRLGLSPRGMPEQRAHWRQRQNATNTYIVAVPLEHQHAARLQHAETLAETCGQIAFPIAEQSAVQFRRSAILAQRIKVGRVKHHQIECVVGVIHLREIAYHIRTNLQ